MAEQEPQSFVLKIWVEETAEEAGQAKWRGHITHVPSHSRQYVEDLDEIVLFVASYLERLNVQVTMLKYLCLPLRQRQSDSAPTDRVEHLE